MERLILKSDSHLLFIIDLMVIVIISVSISLTSHHLLWMTIFVPAILFLRLVVLASLKQKEDVHLKGELLFFFICILIGAFNDWNSVCNKQIYDYTVPVYFPEIFCIPIWMLIYWGMILRFITRMARWTGISKEIELSNKVGIGKYYIANPYVKIGLELVLVLGTRQTIYYFYLDPYWSWIPFLVAVLLFLIVFYPSKGDYLLIVIFLIGGPAIEILYIKAGNLHQYHMGWVWGIPLWLILWWVLSVLIWKDISLRVEHFLKQR